MLSLASGPIKGSISVCYNYSDIIITLKVPNSIKPQTTLPRQQRGLYPASDGPYMEQALLAQRLPFKKKKKNDY